MISALLFPVVLANFSPLMGHIGAKMGLKQVAVCVRCLTGSLAAVLFKTKDVYSLVIVYRIDIALHIQFVVIRFFKKLK